MKYYFALKEMCLKFNYNGERIIGIKPDKIIRIQEYTPIKEFLEIIL